MAKNEGIVKWILGAGALIVAGMIILPRLGFGASPKAATPVIPPAALGKPAQNYSVANAQYGYAPSVNFSGLALEQPTNAMPLGFGLTNIL
jgi:hypothetical protein